MNGVVDRLRPPRHWKPRVKRALSGLALYISVVGLVTFTLFILEESIQMATFGSWPAQQAKDWRTVLAGCDQIRTVNRLLKIVNYGLGWIQPLAFLSYRAYGESTDIYVQGLEAKIFAHAPELFNGRTITFTFRPRSVEKTASGYVARNRRILVASRKPLVPRIPFRISGPVVVVRGGLPADIPGIPGNRHVVIVVAGAGRLR